MICSSGIGFDPHHQGRQLTFGFHGIWQGVAVLYDKETKSLWMHLSGECIDGPLEGAKVDLITGRHVQWREWKRDHPMTRVMAEDLSFLTRYSPEKAARRGQDFFPNVFLSTIDDRDDRLSPSSLLYGIKTATATRAYPFTELTKLPAGILNDTIGEEPVVILFESDTRSAAAHSRKLDEQTLVFQRDPAGFLVDVESKSRFDRDGVCVEGLYQGKRLSMVVGTQAEWYGWYATYPETTVFEQSDGESAGTP